MLASWGIGLLSLRQGDLLQALPLLERAMSICHEADLPILFPRVAAALGAAYSLVRRVADAVPLQALDLAEELGMRTLQAHCHRALARCMPR
jgi:hypothetical protein